MSLVEIKYLVAVQNRRRQLFFRSDNAFKNYASLRLSLNGKNEALAQVPMRLWHRCFPVTFARFLSTPFFKEHLVAVSGVCLSGELW